MIDSRRTIVLGALASLLAVGACKDERCVVETTQYTTSVTVKGTFGATLGQPVARFDLTQDFVSHTPYRACADGPLQDVGVVRAKLTSLSAAPMMLTYDLQGLDADGIPVWFHPDSIGSLKPNETLDLGEVSTTATHVDLGARVILKSLSFLP